VNGFLREPPQHSEIESGWVEMPTLSDLEDDSMSVIRGIGLAQLTRWREALWLFDSTMTNHASPRELVFYLHLFAAFSMEKAGESGKSQVQQSLNINPYTSIAAKYMIMCLLADLARADKVGVDRQARSKALAELGGFVNRYKHVFTTNDKWFTSFLEGWEQIVNNP
jgi:hypothetical protein